MKIIFAGTPHFAASALAGLLKEHQIVAVLTQPDRPAGRGMQLAVSPVKQLALQHNLPVLQPATLKTAGVQREIAALDADVMVVAAYGLILPQAVLQIPRYGCLNIHASLLSRWRGAAPVQRAILAGDTETGITIMQMDEGLDTGAMLLRHVCRIAPEDTAQTLHDKLAELGAGSILEALRLLHEQRLTPVKQDDTAQTLHDKLAVIGADSILEALRLLQEHRLTPVKQDNDAATYAAKLLKSEGRIDWRQDALYIERAVRAFNPFPVCQADFNGAAIKIWQATLIRQQGEPGAVLAADKRGITVACGNDALRLEVLQRPGGKAQPAAQFLQAVPVRPGDCFS